jgi:hypothetical protein
LAVGCWLLAVGCWLLAVGCFKKKEEESYKKKAFKLDISGLFMFFKLQTSNFNPHPSSMR